MSRMLAYFGLGILSGMVGMYVLLARPLFDPPGAAPIRTTDGQGNWFETFHIRPTDILALTGDQRFAGARHPKSIGPVPGDIAGSSVLTAKVRNAAGDVVGVASRYIVAERQHLPPDRLWTLVLTRRGTIATGCAAPGSETCGSIVGGTGSFAGIRGRLVERQKGAGFELILASKDLT